MRTSLIANETNKIIPVISASKSATAAKQHTSTFAKSLRKYANGRETSTQTTSSEVRLVSEAKSESESELSSVPSSSTEDVKEATSSIVSHATRKRKRGAEQTVTSRHSHLAGPRRAVKRLSGDSSAHPPKNVVRAKRQPAEKIVAVGGDVEVHAPAGWKEIYDAVKEMRSKTEAPVDTMGCETLADEKVSPRDKRFQTLIALMLSSQTKDTTNAIAMRRLQTELPAPGLTLENILAVESEKLNELIYVVGFHNNKTRYIKATALLLRDHFNNEIPDTIEGLMSLPGVGPKMAYLCMAAAWGRIEGIGVDVHVDRITRLWGWHQTKTPEQTRASLEAWLPRDKWHEINHLLVGFGQTICLPVGRRCGECTLSERGLCPAAVVGKVKKEKAKKVKKRFVGKGNESEEGNQTMEVETVEIKEEEITAADLEDYGVQAPRILRSRLRQH